jgi:hypothetical protein
MDMTQIRRPAIASELLDREAGNAQRRRRWPDQEATTSEE